MKEVYREVIDILLEKANQEESGNHKYENPNFLNDLVDLIEEYYQDQEQDSVLRIRDMIGEMWEC